jgi:hypothetical protein
MQGSWPPRSLNDVLLLVLCIYPCFLNPPCESSVLTRPQKNPIPSHSQRLIPVIFIAAFNWPILVISIFSHPLWPFGAFGAGIAGFQQVLFRHFRSQHYAAIRP